MENFIKVYDDFIPLNLQNHLKNTVFYDHNIPWYPQLNISGAESDSTFGFSQGLYSSQHPLKINYSLFFSFLQIPYILAYKLNFSIKEIYQSRLFLTTISLTPRTVYEGIHIDMDNPHYVCLYYINDSDGDTVFFDNNKKTEIKRITPKKGRIAFFSGNIPHCTSIPGKNNRLVCNTNFFIESFGKEKEN